MTNPEEKEADKYHSLFNSLDEGFHISELIYNELGTPVDWRYLEVNQAFERQTGILDAPGKLGSVVAPGTGSHWFEAYDIVIKTGQTLRFENYNRSTRRWYSAYTLRVGDQGSTKFAVLFYDITERKTYESQQQYWSKLNDTLRSIGDSVEIEKAVTRLAMDYFNADRCYYCRIEQGNFIIRRDAARAGLASVVGVYPLNSFAIFGKIIRDGRPVVVHDAHTSDVLDDILRSICVQLQLISFIDIPVIKNDEAVGLLCIVHSTPRIWSDTEIALAAETAERTWAAVERAIAEEDLRKNEQQLRQLIKQRDEFIGIASHELNTPVTTIKAYAQIVQQKLQEAGDKTNTELVTRLNTQINKLSSLVTTLLDTTTIAQGQLSLHLEDLDINELLRECTEEIARTSNHVFALQLLPVPFVSADRRRIGQVITNLLSNAIKYSAGGTTIAVQSKQESDAIKVSVQDKGLGIPAADLPRVFERFFRVTANKMDTYPGTGLGLYVSQQIIERHSGTISVESMQGVGSIFSFTLPLQDKSDIGILEKRKQLLNTKH